MTTTTLPLARLTLLLLGPPIGEGALSHLLLLLQSLQPQLAFPNYFPTSYSLYDKPLNIIISKF